MFIDEKLNEMRLEIIKDEEMSHHLQKIDQELLECIISKKQLHQAMQTVDEWKHAHKYSILRLFKHKKRLDYTRKRVSAQEIQAITENIRAIDARMNELLDEAATMRHRIQEIINLMTDYEILVSEKIERISDHPYIDEIIELDEMIKLQMDNLHRNNSILSMGTHLRNCLIQFRRSNGFDEVDWAFELEESSLYHFHQLIDIEEKAISQTTLNELVDAFKTEIQIHNLYLPYTLEDVQQRRRFRKFKERIVVSWYETYDALNKILDHFWEMNRTIKRRIRDLYQHRHSKVVYSTIEEGVVNR